MIIFQKKNIEYFLSSKKPILFCYTIHKTLQAYVSISWKNRQSAPIEVQEIFFYEWNSQNAGMSLFFFGKSYETGHYVKHCLVISLKICISYCT